MRKENANFVFAPGALSKASFSSSPPILRCMAVQQAAQDRERRIEERAKSDLERLRLGRQTYSIWAKAGHRKAGRATTSSPSPSPRPLSLLSSSSPCHLGTHTDLNKEIAARKQAEGVCPLRFTSRAFDTPLTTLPRVLFGLRCTSQSHLRALAMRDNELRKALAQHGHAKHHARRRRAGTKSTPQRS